jgi:hypothetical protein
MAKSNIAGTATWHATIERCEDNVGDDTTTFWNNTGVPLIDRTAYLKGSPTITALTTTAGVSVGTTLGVTGAATCSSTLGVTGACTLSSTLAVTGTSTLTGAVTCSTTLTVTGAATCSSTLAVTGATTTTGLVTCNGGLTVPLGQTLTVAGTVTTSGTETHSGPCTFSGTSKHTGRTVRRTPSYLTDTSQTIDPSTNGNICVMLTAPAANRTITLRQSTAPIPEDGDWQRVTVLIGNGGNSVFFEREGATGGDLIATIVTGSNASDTATVEFQVVSGVWRLVGGGYLVRNGGDA